MFQDKKIKWRTAFYFREGTDINDFKTQKKAVVYNEKIDVIHGLEITFERNYYYVKNIDLDLDDNIIYVSAYTIK